MSTSRDNPRLPCEQAAGPLCDAPQSAENRRFAAAPRPLRSVVTRETSEPQPMILHEFRAASGVVKYCCHRSGEHRFSRGFSAMDYHEWLYASYILVVKSGKILRAKVHFWLIWLT